MIRFTYFDTFGEEATVAEQRGQWGSRLGFILAAAGSAVGLGNIWKFPYITGENGGGLFVLIYLVCIALVGIPIMMAEIMIGRAAQAQPVVAFEKLQGRKTPWAGVGWLGVLAGFVILSYYVVVAGWAMDYTLKSVVNVAKPIHKQAEQDAVTYRATADIGDMRFALIQREYERRIDEKLSPIRSEAKPSVWRTCEEFTEALAAADAVNVTMLEIVQDVWAGHEESELTLFAASMPPGTTVTEKQRASFNKVQTRLFGKKDFKEALSTAAELRDKLEIAQRDLALEIEAEFADYDEATILNLAEDQFRRDTILSQVQAAFTNVSSDGWTCLFWSILFMLITILIVAGGISSGIERACRLLMPTLIVLILVMVVYGMFQSGFGRAASFVFKPDPSRLKASGVLEALGHAFFTLSLGMGAMITYGSYQKSKKGIVGQSITIAVLDTFIALMACLMIFPIIFSYDQEAAAGPGLVFMSMPLAFAEIGAGGMLLAILFFGLLVFAALTSAISLLEVVASYFIDQLGWTRKRAAWTMGGVILAVGVGSAFSLDPNFMMEGWEPSFGKNFFDTMDYLASNWMLPMGGLLIALYCGWAMPKRLRDAELTDVPPLLVIGWLILVRFIAPALVIVVLLQKVGILEADEVFHGLFN
jgi:NSS family neurotransmitter:Na+ symporter